MTNIEFESIDGGTKVTYTPDYGDNEKGIIKRVFDKNHAFVVYNCDNNWNNYQNYTAAKTRREDLKLGWIS